MGCNGHYLCLHIHFTYFILNDRTCSRNTSCTQISYDEHDRDSNDNKRFYPSIWYENFASLLRYELNESTYEFKHLVRCFLVHLASSMDGHEFYKEQTCGT